jgi:hypothetical protein
VQRNTLKSKFYGLPIYRIGYVTAISILIVGFVIIFIDGIISLQTWIPIVILIAILAIGGLGLISSTTARDIIEEIDTETKQKTEFISELQVRLSAISYKIKDGLVKNKFSKLVEDVRYSDPMSNEKTKGIEYQISKYVVELEELLVDDQINVILTKIDNLSSLIKQRNDLCKLNKE